VFVADVGRLDGVLKYMNELYDRTDGATALIVISDLALPG